MAAVARKHDVGAKRSAAKAAKNPLKKRLKAKRQKLKIKAAGGSALAGFQIADSKRNFITAQAEIVGDTVVVQSPEISKPEAVRYLWESFPQAVSLFNKEGLPASPFRTDAWNEKP